MDLDHLIYFRRPSPVYRDLFLPLICEMYFSEVFTSVGLPSPQWVFPFELPKRNVCANMTLEKSNVINRKYIFQMVDFPACHVGFPGGVVNLLRHLGNPPSFRFTFVNKSSLLLNSSIGTSFNFYHLVNKKCTLENEHGTFFNWGPQ